MLELLLETIRDWVHSALANKVDKISALPTPKSSYVGYIYLLTGTQTGYKTGLIYKCVETSTDNFEWKPIADLITRSEMEQAITQNPITKDEVLNYLLKGNN